MPTISRSWLVALWLCALSSLSHAETAWQCWYDRALHVACVLLQGAPAARTDDPQQRARTQATGMTLPGPLPPLVKTLHENHEALRGQIIRIPLHSEPGDHRFVGELAQAVMCGGRSDCVAVYSERPSRQLLSAMAFADAIDPLRARE